MRQDDARVILASPELRQMMETVEAQQKQFDEINSEQLLPGNSAKNTGAKTKRLQ